MTTEQLSGLVIGDMISKDNKKYRIKAFIADNCVSLESLTDDGEYFFTRDKVIEFDYINQRHKKTDTTRIRVREFIKAFKLNDMRNKKVMFRRFSNIHYGIVTGFKIREYKFISPMDFKWFYATEYNGRFYTLEVCMKNCTVVEPLSIHYKFFDERLKTALDLVKITIEPSKEEIDSILQSTFNKTVQALQTRIN